MSLLQLAAHPSEEIMRVDLDAVELDLQRARLLIHDDAAGRMVTYDDGSGEFAEVVLNPRATIADASRVADDTPRRASLDATQRRRYC